MAGSFGDIEPELESDSGAGSDAAAAARLFCRFGVYALVLAAIVAVGGCTIMGLGVGLVGCALLWAGVRG
jgi:hypothetical protein